MLRSIRLPALLCLLALLAACGNKGELVKPGTPAAANAAQSSSH